MHFFCKLRITFCTSVSQILSCDIIAKGHHQTDIMNWKHAKYWFHDFSLIIQLEHSSIGFSRLREKASHQDSARIRCQTCWCRNSRLPVYTIITNAPSEFFHVYINSNCYTSIQFASILASSWDYGIFYKRWPAKALCCLHTWSMEVDKGSNRKSDI